MKLYLVQDYNHIEFDKSSTIVALTPQACYYLAKDKIEYSIIEDYCDIARIASEEEDEYYRIQREWINELDTFLQSDVKLGSAYYLFLKMILDSPYIRYRTLTALFESVKPSKVVFIYSQQSTDIDERLRSKASIYSKIIPVICRVKNIALEILPAQLGRIQPSTENIRQKLSKVNVVKNVHAKTTYALSYCRKQAFFKQMGARRLNILVIRLGYGIGTDFIIDAIKHGHKIFQPIPENPQLFLTKRKWEKTLRGSNLIENLNRQYNPDITEVLLLPLEKFISDVCPKLLWYYTLYSDFYRANKIDIVVMPFTWSIAECAALACAKSFNIPVISVCHGDDICQDKFWRNIELESSAILIASNIESQENYKTLAKSAELQTKVFSSPQRFTHIDKIRHNRKGKGPIVFLTTMTQWDHCRVGSYYPDTWYYKFQQEIVKYLSTREEQFIWKCLPQADAIYNPITDFIKDNGFSNIQIATNLFTEHLCTADRVICDLPSTGFYESVIAGVPTMSLYPKFFRVRATAEILFEKLLKPFSTTTEAIGHINNFLDNNNPELYRVNIDRGEKSILDIIEEEVP